MGNRSLLTVSRKRGEFTTIKSTLIEIRKLADYIDFLEVILSMTNASAKTYNRGRKEEIMIEKLMMTSNAR